MKEKRGRKLPRWLSIKESTCNAGDQVQFLGREDPLEEEMAAPSQYSCLENPTDRGAWQVTVRGVAKSQT